jgi:trehalose 6-phosphate synthase/phosphatase
MHHGLTMSEPDKDLRHERLYKVVTTHTAHKWAATLVKQLLTQLNSSDVARSTPFIPSSHLEEYYRNSSARRLFLFDYDGTLTPIVKVPSMALPSEHALEALGKLSEDERNVVFIISGRDQEFLETHFGKFQKLGLSAEHGAFIREPGSTRWSNFTETMDMDWMQEVHEIFKYYTEVCGLDMLLPLVLV